MPKTRKLTPKQSEFVDEYARTKNATKSAMIAYDVNNIRTASVVGSENLAKPDVSQAIEKALKRHKITIDKALIPIANGLQATKMNEYTGELSEDLNIQLKASDRALKLLGVSNNSGQPTVFLNQI